MVFDGLLMVFDGLLMVFDGLLMEFEWQQVSSSLQDSSQYSVRSKQCCSLNGLHSSSNFQVPLIVLYSLYRMLQSWLV